MMKERKRFEFERSDRFLIGLLVSRCYLWDDLTGRLVDVGLGRWRLRVWLPVSSGGIS